MKSKLSKRDISDVYYFLPVAVIGADGFGTVVGLFPVCCCTGVSTGNVDQGIAGVDVELISKNKNNKSKREMVISVLFKGNYSSHYDINTIATYKML